MLGLRDQKVYPSQLTNCNFTMLIPPDMPKEWFDPVVASVRPQDVRDKTYTEAMCKYLPLALLGGNLTPCSTSQHLEEEALDWTLGLDSEAIRTYTIQHPQEGHPSTKEVEPAPFRDHRRDVPPQHRQITRAVLRCADFEQPGRRARSYVA